MLFWTHTPEERERERARREAKPSDHHLDDVAPAPDHTAKIVLPS